MSKLLTGGLLFLVIIGLKFGALDTSVIASLALLFIVLIKDKIKVNSKFLIIISLTLFIALYSIFISYLYSFPDSYVILRAVRCLISTFCVGIFLSNYPQKSDFILKVILNTLAVHAILIVLQMLFPQLQNVMMGLTGFDKGVVMLRAFGLSSGYDSAGYLCIVGLIISVYYLIYKGVSLVSIFYIYLFILGGVFTGRSVMFIMMPVVILLNLYLLFKGKILYKAFSIINFSVGSYLVFTFLIPLLVATLPFLKDQNLVTVATNDIDYTQSFAGGSGDTLMDMFFLPDSVTAILFGSGQNPANSDIGYIKLIFMIGVLGAIVTVVIYLYMLFTLFNIRKVMQQSTDLNDKVIYKSLIWIIVCMFFFNIKTLYLMSRNFHEIIIICLITTFNIYNKYKNSLINSPSYE